MTSKLAGCHSRLDRVIAGRDRLNREILDWFAVNHPHEIHLEVEPEHPNEIVIYIEPPSELPADWPVVLGEMIHNVRAALDNRTWLLAEEHSDPPPGPFQGGALGGGCSSRSIATRRRFGELGGDWGALLDPADWAVLETAQPYQGPNRSRPVQMGYLQELSNADKHRTLHVLSSYQAGLVNPPVWVTAVQDCVVEPSTSSASEDDATARRRWAGFGFALPASTPSWS